LTTKLQMLAKVLTKRRFKRIKKLLKSYETSIYEHITSQIFKQKRFTAHYLCKPLFLLVRPARFELATYGFVVRQCIAITIWNYSHFNPSEEFT